MKSIRLGTQIRQIAVITILIGLVSYEFNFVVARLLTSEDAARVMTCWTALNLCLLTIQFPIELYGPRLLRSMTNEAHQDLFDLLVVIHILLTSIATSGLFIFYYRIRYEFNFLEVGSFILVISASSWFQLNRTLNIARENLERLVRSALLLSVASVIFFSLLVYSNADLSSGPLVVTAICFLLSAILSARFIDVSWSKLKWLIQNGSQFFEMFSFKEVGALSLSNLVSLLLVPGGAIFTGLVGLNADQTVVYLASTALSLIPMTILNSTTMPIYLRAINLFNDKKMNQFKKLFLKSSASYLGISAIMILLLWIAGERAFLLYIGNNYQYSQVVLLLSAVTVCISFVGSMPRLFLMALGETRQTYKPLVITVLVYLLLVVSIKSGYVGLFTASISSSVFISLMTLRLLQKNFNIHRVEVG